MCWLWRSRIIRVWAMEELSLLICDPLIGRKEWETEINVLGAVEHPNLVKLIGYCADDDETRTQLLLVYEYMVNGSVEDHLYAKSKTPLSWTMRLKVAQDAARGLTYLHEELDVQIVLRDFKPSNILLDDQWNAKLADFGLAMLRPQQENSQVSTRPGLGTMGYIAPEYFIEGHHTFKSDVWSYGVFLYELITGRRPIDCGLPLKEQMLIEWVKPYVESKRFNQIVDPRLLKGNYPLKSAEKLSIIADKCLSVNPKSRPKMSEVLEVLRSNQLFAKLSKCEFGGTTVEYLGHIISKEGVATDPKKIDAVAQWPAPTNVKQLRGFLGLSGYYRRFIKSYGILAKPLTSLLKKDNFVWNEEARIAFEKLKEAVCSPPVLALPDFDKTFVLETDASALGIGAVLMQDNHPLAFISKALSSRQQTCSVYEKELLAILYAVKHWHYYLSNGHFIIRTDQKSLKYLMEQKLTTPLQHVWLSKMLGYDYEIVYKEGRENQVADALSRVSGPALLTISLSTLDTSLLQRIKASWSQDLVLLEKIGKIEKGEIVPGYKWDGQLLMKGNRVVVGNDMKLQQDIIQLCHSSGMGGHSGVHATTQRIKGMFKWKGLHKQVRQYIRTCDICQRVKTENVAYPGLLQPLPIPKSVFSDISMDFIGGFPRVNGKDSVMVVVDRLTKYGHFIPISHPYSAMTVAQLFMDHVFKLHGWPQTIVSDRDPIFLSNFWKEFTKMHGVQLAMSTAYHPQSDGQTEVVNRCIEAYLRAMTLSTSTPWLKWLSLAEWWYNTNFHSTIQTTPFQALYGYPPPLFVPYIPKDCNVEAVDQLCLEREQLLQELRKHLLVASNRMKQKADKKRSERELEVGQWVYLKLQDYRQNSLRNHKHHKLSPKYFGPFLIIEKVGAVAYKLDLPEEAQLHPVFHVSLLKPAHGDHSVILPLPAQPRFRYSPATVLDKRMMKKNNRMSMEVLIKWNDLPIADASWENLEEMMIRFPEFHFE
ncbi:putative nucleotidyltransferase, Ribonuclease H, protein kinase RLK-Pelle-RLCK-VIIa-2 family [Helianthus annuus]|nr:putative nucleotidyltransferase, Ribonuclease H, protein kinase RLK-Pelle-RLCK-VIIa-2 family [Helianthus annuus]